MWDSTEVLNIVASIGVLITAVGAVIVNIIVAVRTGKKVDENVKAIAGVSHQVAEVHTITNSNLSAVKAELKQATMQIEEMKAFVRDLKGEREKLATLTALNTTPPNSHSIRSSRISDIAPATEVKEVLDAIEENTLNIDKNTQVLKTSIDKNTIETAQNTKATKEKK